jgi:hypothetical protein
MRPLSASDLLRIWETGAGGIPPARQALLILQIAFPETSAAQFTRLTVGQRDTCLLRLRELTFGPRIQGRVDCPICHEPLEMEFDLGELLTPGVALPDFETLESINPDNTFGRGPYTVTYHLPTSADLIALPDTADLALARQQLLQTCVTSVQCHGEVTPLSELPEEIMQALIEHMGEADSLANLAVSSECPTCRHNWPILFDIVTYFWGEINAWALRLLREVHVLASAYGWRETDILAMSVWRRQRYLELIGL